MCSFRNKIYKTTNTVDWGEPLTEREKVRGRSIVSDNQTMSELMKNGLQQEKVLVYFKSQIETTKA